MTPPFAPTSSADARNGVAASIMRGFGPCAPPAARVRELALCSPGQVTTSRCGHARQAQSPPQEYPKSPVGQHP